MVTWYLHWEPCSFPYPEQARYKTLKWLGSWTEVSLCAYLTVESTRLWDSLVIRQRKKKKKSVTRFIVFETSHASHRHIPEGTSRRYKAPWGQSWIPLDSLGLVGEAAEIHDSWFSSPARGTCPTSPQKEIDHKLGEPGRKPEACLGWLETWKDPRVCHPLGWRWTENNKDSIWL